MKPLLIGEAPSRTGDPYWRHPLSGNPSIWLCRALGLDLPKERRDRVLAAYMHLRRRFDVVNVLERYPGAKWPDLEAAEAATKLDLTGRRHVVLLGRNVARAVGFRHHTEAEFFTSLHAGGSGTTFHFAPHPSRRSHVWNDPENERRLGELLRSTLA